MRGWLHLVAFVASVPAAIMLMLRAGPGRGVAVYGVALTGLFGVSAGYHLLPWSPGARSWMRRLDHGFIYIFIAAAYTPFCLAVTPRGSGPVILALCWCGAVVGFLLKIVAFERAALVAGPLYLGLGWLGALNISTYAQVLTGLQFGLLLLMGSSYTVGAAVLAVRRPDPFPTVFGYHEIWHAMVVAAGACYFAVMWSLTAGRH